MSWVRLTQAANDLKAGIAGSTPSLFTAADSAFLAYLAGGGENAQDGCLVKPSSVDITAITAPRCGGSSIPVTVILDEYFTGQITLDLKYQTVATGAQWLDSGQQPALPFNHEYSKTYTFAPVAKATAYRVDVIPGSSTGTPPLNPLTPSVLTSGAFSACVGSPPPISTPELGSGELLATGLVPALAVFLYRRRRRRAA